MSTQKPPIETALAGQTEALSLYLEALFADQPASLPVPVFRPAIDVPVARAVIDLPATLVEPAVSAPVAADALAPVGAVDVVTPVPAHAIRSPSMTVAVESRPDWATEPFPCLLLKVHGLSLALPLVKLNRILTWAEPTLIPGYASWLLGVLRPPGLERNLKVVDTAVFVMPERLPAGSATNPVDGHESRHIVMIGNGEWGLTCEDVSSIISIDPDRVRWRTSRSKRPWLAGTVTEHLCALLDTERLAEILSAGAPGLPS